MTEHRLKIFPVHFSAVAQQKKKVEIRRDDRLYRVGDLLILCEFDAAQSIFTGREVRRVVSHITRDVYGLLAGFVLLSLES